MEYIVRVGVAIIVKRNGKVLLGKRKGSHGSGTWAFPGGHMEFGETIKETVKRELVEETGLIVESIKLGPYTNDFMPEDGKHYITLFAIVEEAAGEAEIKEPEKCEEWRWVKWGEIPEPQFIPLKKLREKGFNPFEESTIKGYDFTL